MYFAQLLARRLARTNVEMAGELASGMTGKLSDITPTELFQALNSNQKTGILTLSMPDSEAELSFKEGGLIGASYRDLEGEEAFFALLKESQGRFKFFPGLPPEDMEANEIGDFMWLLMEGLNRIDEGS
jgi:hypothetical protein